MRTVSGTIMWQSTHRFEAPDDWDGDVFSLPDDILWELNPKNAEPYDWEFHG